MWLLLLLPLSLSAPQEDLHGTFASFEERFGNPFQRSDLTILATHKARAVAAAAAFSCCFWHAMDAAGSGCHSSALGAVPHRGN